MQWLTLMSAVMSEVHVDLNAEHTILKTASANSLHTVTDVWNMS